MFDYTRALAHYNALLSAVLNAPAPPACDFCGRDLHEGQAYRHPACNTLAIRDFGPRLSR